MRNSSKTLSLYKKFLEFFKISSALRGCLKNHLVTLNIFTVALIPRKKATLKTNHEAKKSNKKGKPTTANEKKQSRKTNNREKDFDPKNITIFNQFSLFKEMKNSLK